ITASTSPFAVRKKPRSTVLNRSRLSTTVRRQRAASAASRYSPSGLVASIAAFYQTGRRRSLRRGRKLAGDPAVEIGERAGGAGGEGAFLGDGLRRAAQARAVGRPRRRALERRE